MLFFTHLHATFDSFPAVISRDFFIPQAGVLMPPCCLLDFITFYIYMYDMFVHLYSVCRYYYNVYTYVHVFMCSINLARCCKILKFYLSF